MMRVLPPLFFAAALAQAAVAQTAPPPLQLGLPIACTLGTDCFVQQYADVQPGSGARDYACGIATYDEHSGTDFRVLSLKAAETGVPVIAAASGRVKGTRDGVDDRLIARPEDRAAIEGRECGNGVVIDHGGGWETQYCHMRRGTVKVRKGETVAAGAPLGMVGYSGDAQFAHVHLSVRREGRNVDPFLGDGFSGACQTSNALPAATLWGQEVRGQLAYRDAVVIEAGFATGPVTPDTAERGMIPAPGADGPALVFYGRLINLRAGDRLRFAAEGPGGFKAGNESEPMPNPKAHYVGFAGKKRTAERWPAGVYRGTVSVIRDGREVSEATRTLTLP
jgi:hypothetical protein